MLQHAKAQLDKCTIHMATRARTQNGNTELSNQNTTQVKQKTQKRIEMKWNIKSNNRKKEGKREIMKIYCIEWLGTTNAIAPGSFPMLYEAGKSLFRGHENWLLQYGQLAHCERRFNTYSSQYSHGSDPSWSETALNTVLLKKGTSSASCHPR